MFEGDHSRIIHAVSRSHPIYYHCDMEGVSRQMNCPVVKSLGSIMFNPVQALNIITETKSVQDVVLMLYYD